MTDRQKATQGPHDVIHPDGDRKPLSVTDELRGLLDSVKDHGTEISSGTDGVSGDLWITIQGIEYFISIRKSNFQLSKERKLTPLHPATR